MTCKLILDLDTGIDDTLAIAYALASEQADDVRLIGITGTYGNVTVETGMRNALAVTDLLGHPEVSVYPGLDRPSTAPENFRYSPSAGTRRIHGDNGIGDMTIPDSRRSPETTAAALDPTLVTTLGMNLQVDLEGAYRGRTIGDRAHDRLTYSHKTTQVAVRVDIARFKSQFLDRITALASH